MANLPSSSLQRFDRFANGSRGMKTIGIEAFLSWAYVEELPKAGREPPMMGRGGAGGYAGGWDAVSQQGELLAEMVSDCRPNQYGVLPIAIDCGPPHPDALAAHAAISALDHWEVGFPGDWNPLADMNLCSRRYRRLRRARALAHPADRRHWPCALPPAPGRIGAPPCDHAQRPGLAGEGRRSPASCSARTASRHGSARSP